MNTNKIQVVKSIADGAGRLVDLAQKSPFGPGGQAPKVLLVSPIAIGPDSQPEQLHIDQWEPYSQTELIPVGQAIGNILSWLDRNQQNVFHGSTQIIIAPGYDYKIVRMLVTNFHQPQSTLLLLVSAFVHGDWHTIYDYALSHDFRFLSYGDSSLLIP